MKPVDFYEKLRVLGLTDEITSNSDPDYCLPFYQNIFSIMEDYALLQIEQLSTPEQLLPVIEKVFGPGCAVICKERKRQIEVEGWTPEHDNFHENGSLSLAAAMYIMSENQRIDELLKTYDPMSPPTGCPLSAKWWKPTPNDRPRELAKGGALIAAEIDRLKRKEE